MASLESGLGRSYALTSRLEADVGQDRTVAFLQIDWRQADPICPKGVT